LPAHRVERRARGVAQPGDAVVDLALAGRAALGCELGEIVGGAADLLVQRGEPCACAVGLGQLLGPVAQVAGAFGGESESGCGLVAVEAAVLEVLGGVADVRGEVLAGCEQGAPPGTGFSAWNSTQ